MTDAVTVIDYLRALAPEAFVDRVEPASDEDIARLEAVAGVSVSDGHRQFLRAMGNTPVSRLDPFVDARDFSIDTLVNEYGRLAEQGFVVPRNVVFFASSESLGSTLFLQQSEDPRDDPQIGDLDSNGRFIPIAPQYFEEYLRWQAFHFRMSQLDERVHVGPRWNGPEARWEPDLDLCRAALAVEGFQPVFSTRGAYCEYHERDGIAVALYHEGGMAMAGDDRTLLHQGATAVGGRAGLAVESATLG